MCGPSAIDRVALFRLEWHRGVALIVGETGPERHREIRAFVGRQFQQVVESLCHGAHLLTR